MSDKEILNGGKEVEESNIPSSLRERISSMNTKTSYVVAIVLICILVIMLVARVLPMFH